MHGSRAEQIGSVRLRAPGTSACVSAARTCANCCTTAIPQRAWEMRRSDTSAFTAHVNVGFFLGAHLADPPGLLDGTGKNMRHVKLRPSTEIDRHALAALIQAAYSLVKPQARSGRAH